MVLNHQFLQILQLSLFSIPLLTFLGMGILILVKPVVVISRRWMLLVFLPLLLANPLAILANETLSPTAVLGDWQFWLILGADLALTVGAVLTLRGYAIYGLSPDEVKSALQQSLTESGSPLQTAQRERKSFWGSASDAAVFSWESKGESHECYLVARAGEVSLNAPSRPSLKALQTHLAVIRRMKVPYNFSRHAIGIIYLVIALVFAVLSWIFFFEPRLVLIE